MEPNHRLGSRSRRLNLDEGERRLGRSACFPWRAPLPVCVKITFCILIRRQIFFFCCFSSFFFSFPNSLRLNYRGQRSRLRSCGDLKPATAVGGRRNPKQFLIERRSVSKNNSAPSSHSSSKSYCGGPQPSGGRSAEAVRRSDCGGYQVAAL